MPLTNARTESPLASPRSDTIGETSHSAISSIEASFSRRRPGSPWIPIPTSTSSSPSSNVGVPAAGTPTFELGDDEVEVGIGIHGEPGRRREKIAAIDEMAEWLVTPIVSDLGLTRGDSVLAFVNGMGGTPLIELYGAFNSVNKILGGQGIAIGRSLVGNYITSLEMAGFSVTLLKLDDDLVKLWDDPVHTPALRWRV
jgi:dihydroxyacetone kinase